MAGPDGKANIGLGRAIRALESAWGGATLEVGLTQRVLGRKGMAGMNIPQPSSAATISLEGETVWVPAPLLNGRDDAQQAPVFLFGGSRYVMPFIRLISRGLSDEPEYLSFSHWVSDSLTRWRFVRRCDGRLVTVLDTLVDYREQPRRCVRILGNAIWYALFGLDTGGSSFCIAPGLKTPSRGMWLRPLGSGQLAERVARSLVITAKLTTQEDTPSQANAAEIPTTRVWGKYARIQPIRDCDFGLDPVHTPENGNIRLTARLGVGVRVSDRRKLEVSSGGVPMSPSSASLPYAGYNDPRRLLMAANAQVHAVDLERAEEPLVGRPVRDDLPLPSGCNLRVAYVAWHGLNHEDAWVISESAAKRLLAKDRWTQTVFVSAVESVPHVLVAEGDLVHRGQLLLQRRVCPAMLDVPVSDPLGSGTEPGFVDVAPEPGDRAKTDGRVVSVDIVDLDCSASTDLQGPGLRAVWRAAIRVTLTRQLELAVGDKLANRHGHKGIVGAIVPDSQMPCWQGHPLEALVDPISVLNRSNWGQVWETLAGSLGKTSAPDAATGSLRADAVLSAVGERGGDSCGRTEVRLPTGECVNAIAGKQFVMRLPHHARDKLSVGRRVPTHGSAPRIRPQRFGEMETWAAWAHGLTPATEYSPRLSRSAKRVSRLLAIAGYELVISSIRADSDENQRLALRQLSLDAPPPSSWTCLNVGKAAKRRELYEQIDAIEPDSATALVFDAPITMSCVPDAPEVRWLPVLPLLDRPAGRRGQAHALTLHIRRVVREAISQARNAESPTDSSTDGDRDRKLRSAIRMLQREARRCAVGLRATGTGSSKASLLRRAVFGTRIAQSARATAAPAAPGLLGLDEIGIPLTVARALLGSTEDDLDDEQVGRRIGEVPVWIKRDPVLHRWGLLRVRAKITDGDVIRLPASMLSPMGADFDGDTVALFARIPGYTANHDHAAPSSIAWDVLLERPMFVPGKQYVCGLELLQNSLPLTEVFQSALAAAGAPRWPAEKDPVKALREWVCKAHQEDADGKGRWWAIIERHAAGALMKNPGMDLGVLPTAKLADLLPVRCGAAKRHSFDSANELAFISTQRIMDGRSLDIFNRTTITPPAPLNADAHTDNDPIEAVMAVAKASVGRFGGVLRRILYSMALLDEPRTVFVAAAQVLTEQHTQLVLSVKAGEAPVLFSQYNKLVTLLLKGQWTPHDIQDDSRMRDFLDLWQEMATTEYDSRAPWLQWLREPHTLPEQEEGLPLGDLRVAAFLSTQ